MFDDGNRFSTWFGYYRGRRIRIWKNFPNLTSPVVVQSSAKFAILPFWKKYFSLYPFNSNVSGDDNGFSTWFGYIRGRGIRIWKNFSNPSSPVDVTLAAKLSIFDFSHFTGVDIFPKFLRIHKCPIIAVILVYHLPYLRCNADALESAQMRRRRRRRTNTIKLLSHASACAGGVG
jgi:hypothetical protein